MDEMRIRETTSIWKNIYTYFWSASFHYSLDLNGYFMFLDEKKRGQLDFGVGPLIFLMRKIFRMSLQKMVLYATMKMFTPYLTIFSLTTMLIVRSISHVSLQLPCKPVIDKNWQKIKLNTSLLRYNHKINTVQVTVQFSLLLLRNIQLFLKLNVLKNKKIGAEVEKIWKKTIIFTYLALKI